MPSVLSSHGQGLCVNHVTSYGTLNIPLEKRQGWATYKATTCPLSSQRMYRQLSVVVCMTSGLQHIVKPIQGSDKKWSICNSSSLVINATRFISTIQRCRWNSLSCCCSKGLFVSSCLEIHLCVCRCTITLMRLPDLSRFLLKPMLILCHNC